MNIYGIEGYWNLVWAIPLCIGIGIFIACYWPFGKGPQSEDSGPPYYAGFSANDGHEHDGSCEEAHGEEYTGRHRFDAKLDQYILDRSREE